MIELAAEQGYGAVTIEGLRRRARVSKHTIYEHFAGKDECFLYTYDIMVAGMANRVIAAQEGCDDWQEQLHHTLLAFAREITHEPKTAQLVLVEVFAGGPAAIKGMRRALRRFEKIIARSFASAP